MTRRPEPRPAGRRYSPVVLADDVCQHLNQLGIRTTEGAQLSLSARIAAAQLLTALGVDPVSGAVVEAPPPRG
jgi:hypothetical protein